MPPFIDDFPPVKESDPVRMEDGAEAVGDDEGRFPAKEVLEGLLNDLFRFAVESRGCLVENEHLWIEGERAREGEKPCPCTTAYLTFSCASSRSNDNNSRLRPTKPWAGSFGNAPRRAANAF